MLREIASASGEERRCSLIVLSGAEEERRREEEEEKRRAGRRRGVMCLVFVCDEEETVLGSQQAPGSCPYCGGMVMATDVETQWRLCFLPLCFKTKRRYTCTLCSRRLVLYP